MIGRLVDSFITWLTQSLGLPSGTFEEEDGLYWLEDAGVCPARPAGDEHAEHLGIGGAANIHDGAQ